MTRLSSYGNGHGHSIRIRHSTPLSSLQQQNYSPMAEWTFSWCRSGRACDTLIWGKFTSTRCISYYRWTGEHDVVVVVGSMIIFCFRVFTFTFTGCIEVCNEGIKCFIAALLLAIHDRLSKRIVLYCLNMLWNLFRWYRLLEYYGYSMEFIIPEQPECRLCTLQKQCQIRGRFLCMVLYSIR